MDKIAIGPGYAEASRSSMPRRRKHRRLAEAKGVAISDLTVCILDRPRHASLIDEVRTRGAAIRLIGDGDIAGIIHTVDPDDTGIDMYIGIGGAPEGVLAAAALCCIGGQMQGRLILDTAGKESARGQMGVADPKRDYCVDEMARGDVLFAATGVTDGNLLAGVSFGRDLIVTHTVVMRSLVGHRALDQGASTKISTNSDSFR